MTVGTDRMHRFLVEIARGVEMADSVLAPFTAEEADMWGRLAAQSREIAERGRIIDIPNEWPSMDGYRKGYAPGIEHIP